jgi:hypothetical protein
MAPTKPAKSGAGDGLTLWFVISCAACLLIGMVIGSQGAMWQNRPAPSPASTEMSSKEQAAVAMIRIGFVEWVAACGYLTAKKGGTQRAAMNKCSIEFGLGEPHTGVVEAADRR